SAEALDTRAVFCDGAGNEMVPFFACGPVKNDTFAIAGGLLDPAQWDLQHQSVESTIGNQQVASASQDEQRGVERLGVLDRLADIGFSAGFCEVARRASHAERGERS